MESVRRYAKYATLLRQVAHLSSHQRAEAARIRKNLAALITAAL